MTNGSCHSTAESKVQPWVNPSCSARTIRSTSSLAGGSFCSTRPKSMFVPSVASGQVLAGRARGEPAVAGVPEELPVVDDDPAAAEHGLGVSGDGLPLVRGVVHVHVVRGGG